MAKTNLKISFHKTAYREGENCEKKFFSLK